MRQMRFRLFHCLRCPRTYQPWTWYRKHVVSHLPEWVGVWASGSESFRLGEE